jgi:uncharacterized surface protein with fasciclin (FAS1) repeats
MKNLTTILLTLSLAILTYSCDSYTDAMSDVESESIAAAEIRQPASESTIIDIAETDVNDTFSILVEAARFTGLDVPLDKRNQFTVFAPTNDAFIALLDELNLTQGELFDSDSPDSNENKQLVTAILEYHIVSGKRAAVSLVNADRVNTLAKEFAFLQVDGESLQIGNNDRFANVVVTDIEASNGVIHVIDRVIIPPSLASLLAQE